MYLSLILREAVNVVSKFEPVATDFAVNVKGAGSSWDSCGGITTAVVVVVVGASVVVVTGAAVVVVVVAVVVAIVGSVVVVVVLVAVVLVVIVLVVGVAPAVDCCHLSTL